MARGRARGGTSPAGQEPPAPPEPVKLPPYEGEPVLLTAVSISNTGDGLSDAMAIDPPDLAVRDKVLVVLECEVTEHRHKAIPKLASGLQFVLRLKAGRATIIESETVREALDEQQRKIEEAQGISRLPFEEAGWTEDERVLATQHRQGVHGDEAGLRDGCPLCEEERAALAEEAASGE